VRTRTTYVIVGAGVAGAKAAETLRREGFDGHVVLVGAEPYPPYERPPLSKQLLRGETDVKAAFVHPDDFYTANDIELHVGTRVESIDTRLHALTVDTAESIHYDRLLLATGARPRRLRVPGADLSGIHYLRDLDDAAGLRAELATSTRVAVVGAGWIGSEVAASIRQLGHDVALIDPSPVPLAKVLGNDVGSVYRDLHARHGIELHLGARVERFHGAGRVNGVRMSGGADIDADLVVVGVGVEPDIDLARRAGLTIDGGIAVDALLQTSAPDVFAAGDVAAAQHPFYGRRIRVEHWANAQQQGIAAARNMLGSATAYERLPYFFSDQYDLGMEYSGYAAQWDRVVFRGDPAASEFIAFWIADRRVVAAMNANVWDVTGELQALIRSRQPIGVSRLSDPDVPIESLVGDARAGARRSA
jgi:3-phenylpropionate/trans-cinnamate dioxygenase ferredoxin reductase subunit